MLYRLKPNYYSLLAREPETLKDLSRVYFMVGNLSYKGRKIDVAVPLRSNINRNFQNDDSSYITTRPTSHTFPGNVAGWHFTKLIPVDRQFLQRADESRKDYILAEAVAKTFLNDFKDMAQGMLDRFESGEKVYGAVDFDSALQSMDFMKVREAERSAAPVREPSAQRVIPGADLSDNGPEMD